MGVHLPLCALPDLPLQLSVRPPCQSFTSSPRVFIFLYVTHDVLAPLWYVLTVHWHKQRFSGFETVLCCACFLSLWSSLLFMTRFCYIAQAYLKLKLIPLPQLLQFLDYRHKPLCQAFEVTVGHFSCVYGGRDPLLSLH